MNKKIKKILAVTLIILGLFISIWPAFGALFVQGEYILTLGRMLNSADYYQGTHQIEFLIQASLVVGSLIAGAGYFFIRKVGEQPLKRQIIKTVIFTFLFYALSCLFYYGCLLLNFSYNN